MYSLLWTIIRENLPFQTQPNYSKCKQSEYIKHLPPFTFTQIDNPDLFNFLKDIIFGKSLLTNCLYVSMGLTFEPVLSNVVTLR